MRPKDIGTKGESAIVATARDSGFPHCERVTMRGSRDIGDIRLQPLGLTAGCIIEAKSGKQTKLVSDAQLSAWMAETETERVNAGAAIALLVTQRHGVSHKAAHRWWAFLPAGALATLMGATVVPPEPLEPVRMLLGSALVLLRAGGYGTPLGADVEDGVT